MADAKISALTALTGANTDPVADVLAIVDTSAAATKKILVSELAIAINVLSTPQATTSGTSFDFLSIPAWVKEITIQFNGVSTGAIASLRVQIGDSGGIETSGYVGTGVALANGVVVGSGNYGGGFDIVNGAAANIFHGQCRLLMENSSSNTWTASIMVSLSNTDAVIFGAGSKSTSAALDRVRLTTANGTDAFDAGEVNIIYR